MNSRIIVAGGRDFSNYSMMKRKLDKILSRIAEKPEDCGIVSGGARGADKLGERYANENAMSLIVMRAEWSRFGRKAGYIRNCDMADIATHVVVFWDGKSHGSKMMIDIARKRGLPLRIIRY